MTISRTITRRIAAVTLAFALPVAAHAADEHYISGGAAIDGYDAVAFHTMGKPTKGDAMFATTYQGVTWNFASAENRDLFAASPAKYAPAYGGWCSVGAAKGKKIVVDPNYFAVVDGQLYLNSSKGAHENVFLTDVPGTIMKGERNWKVIFATEQDKL
ncbi:MAG: YHS domain-containing (seleno)protein [Gemmobacter sp.]